MNQYVPNWQKGNTMNMRPPPKMPFPGAPGMNVKPPITGIPPPNPALNTNTNPIIPGNNPPIINNTTTPAANSIIGNIPPKLPASNLVPNLAPPQLTTPSSSVTLADPTKTITPSNPLVSVPYSTTTVAKDNDPTTVASSTTTTMTTNTTPTNKTNSKATINNVLLNTGTNATVQVISSNKVSEFILVYSDNDVSVVSFFFFLSISK